MVIHKKINYFVHLMIIMSLIWCPAPAWSKKNFTDKVKEPVGNSIETRRKSQQELDNWEDERLRLQSKYEIIKDEIEQLQIRRQTLKEQTVSQKELNETLIRRKQESLRITSELKPFLEIIYQRIDTLINSDASFLAKERNHRLKRLKEILDDSEAFIAEQFRKVMETLLVEAEYGNTIEVYRDKVFLSGREISGRIFRFGRISMFFLSMDNQSIAGFNQLKQSWEALDNRYIAAVQAVIEMGAKRRPVELLSLPIGKMITQ